MHLKQIGLAFLLAGAICNRTNAEDWRQFRGPHGNGVIEDASLPEAWGLDFLKRTVVETGVY